MFWVCPQCHPELLHDVAATVIPVDENSPHGEKGTTSEPCKCPNCGALVPFGVLRCESCGWDIAMKSMVDRAFVVLHKAAALINGDRKDDYGDAKESFGRIAKLWSAYLGHDVSSYDVALMMALLKISRASHKYTEDSIVDLIGYAALAAEVRE